MSTLEYLFQGFIGRFVNKSVNIFVKIEVILLMYFFRSKVCNLSCRHDSSYLNKFSTSLICFYYSVRPSKARKQKSNQQKTKIKLHEVKNWNFSLPSVCVIERENDRLKQVRCLKN